MNTEPGAREILARRRQQLLAINEVQRQSLAMQVQVWRGQWQTLARAGNFLARLRDNPLLAGLILCAVVVIKPSRIRAAVSQTRTLWQRVSLFLPLLAALLQRGKE